MTYAGHRPFDLDRTTTTFLLAARFRRVEAQHEMPGLYRIQQHCSPWTACVSLGVLMGSFCLLILTHLWSSYLEGTVSGYLPGGAEVWPPPSPKTGAGYSPVLAYYISGGRGDRNKIHRLLKAVYHPRNQYLLHLDAGADVQERARLANLVALDRTFARFGNVHVIGMADPVDQLGASAVAAMLHGAAVLRKISSKWDWLVNLDASDYPLVSQDDLLFALSSVPRDLNFVDHQALENATRHIIVLDPNLQENTTAEVNNSTGYRPEPNAFRLFEGSPWTILSRRFVEHCIFSEVDNFPRKLLMYLSNTLHPMELFFQTVVGNTAEFKNNTINHNLRFLIERGSGTINHKEQLDAMVNSRAAFAGRFRGGDEGLLDRVDKQILNRPHYGVTPGKWCRSNDGSKDAAVSSKCTTGGGSDIDVIPPPSQSGRMVSSLVRQLIGF